MVEVNNKVAVNKKSNFYPLLAKVMSPLDAKINCLIQKIVRVCLEIMLTSGSKVYQRI